MRPIFRALTALIFLPAVRAQTTFDAAKHHAWSANTGWINWHGGEAPPAGAVSVDSFLQGLIWSANCGWINLGDGTPANGWHYTNASGEDSGVNLNTDGTLTGLAWGENIGWIVFEQTSGRPRLEYLTGEFRGSAWSANTGWINLGEARLFTGRLRCPDTDGDGISDTWEFQHFLTLDSAHANSDADGDGDTDAVEFSNGSDPRNAASLLTITNVDLASPPEAFFTVQGMSRNRLYTLDSSTDLEAWEILAGPVAGIGLDTIFESSFASADPRRFWRVTAHKPLP